MPTYIPAGTYLTVSEAAKAAGVTTSYIRRLIRDSRIAAIPLGPRAWILDTRAVASFDFAEVSSQQKPKPRTKKNAVPKKSDGATCL